MLLINDCGFFLLSEMLDNKTENTFTVYEDNKSAIYMSKNLHNICRTKHKTFDITICDLIEKNKIEVKHISTIFQKADIKSLPM